ncbi:MAG: formate dehydrogenase accessory sulfurtransferase FdhD [Rhodoferax sp.]|jgi:FdhD protein|nr:formate dehydrogenase accessory sulfurtransferase FdhD [Rhodoferax sp.]
MASKPVIDHPAEESSPGSVHRPVLRVRDGTSSVDVDAVASEVPLALSYNGESFAVMMATPLDLEDFALGFSLSEAIICSADELSGIDVHAHLEGFAIDMRIPQARAEMLASRARNVTGNSGCGLCGTRELEQVLRHPAPVAHGQALRATALQRGLAALGAAQPLNQATGATHAAAWAGMDGQLVLLREDVGRHNALDKLIGAMAQSRIEVANGFLILTSRASYEMVQKAATFGIGMIAAISAPTALAIHFAEACGVTLVGFARGTSHVIYTHAQRLISGES